jgi:two-component system sensor histidine kinase UhpB
MIFMIVDAAARKKLCAGAPGAENPAMNPTTLAANPAPGAPAAAASDGVGAAWSGSAAGAGPSLRVRLNAIVATLMILFVVSLAWLRIDATRDSVLEEIVGSNRVASQLLARVTWIVASGGTPAMLDFLGQLGRVRANDITLVDAQGRVLYRSPPSTYKQGRYAPAWFSAWVVPPLQRQVIQVGDGTLTIEADASRAIVDGWDDLRQMLAVAAVALVFINAIVFWVVGRTVRPFAQIVRSLDRMQAGDYATPLPRLHGREAILIGSAIQRLGDAIEGNVRQRIAARETQLHLAQSREWARNVAQRLETERREIAAELHDELGQSVTAIRTLAKSLEARLPPQESVGRHAARLIDSEAARLYDAMHGMIPRLAPLELGPFGLPDALNDLVVAMRELHDGLAIALVVRDMDRPVGADASLVAFRVAQEALNNAIKHSGGRSIDVTLSGCGADIVEVCVDDDGCGLPAPAQRPARFGLTGLRERVLALGGTFEAGCGPLRGTRIVARLPRLAG